MYLLGYDIGSSSVKTSLIDATTGECIASTFYPKIEAKIEAPEPGWAEQDPEQWWKHLKQGTIAVLKQAAIKNKDIKAIGIAYQMHGLVCVDKKQKVIRPAIIWCDSRAVPYGEKAFSALGQEFCLSHLLNSPGNFTASKLAWVKENEPFIFEKIDKIMLPGDYIAMRLTGNISTTISGLSEGIFWDFKQKKINTKLMEYYGFSNQIIPDINPTFSIQGKVTASAAQELGLAVDTPITYRAGDQPNNALSLNVFEPGQIAATAGTSGVVYGVNDTLSYDLKSRVNTFAHINHTLKQDRLGTLLCINGTGILNAWFKRNFANELSYEEINQLAASAPIGSNGACILPFGNGSERVLCNQEIDCNITGLKFNTHGKAEIARAVQEGIAFAFRYGIDIMKSMGMKIDVIHAGKANLFLSPIFREALANSTGASIELYDTDGAIGAAKGAGIGIGIYKNYHDAFSSLKKIQIINPEKELTKKYKAAYQHWLNELGKHYPKH